MIREGLMAAGLSALVLTASCNCTKEAREEVRAEREKEATKVYDVGTPKVLVINLSQKGTDLGPERRFYDNNGDGKTVEQYVELFYATFGAPLEEDVQVNLIRPGAEPRFNLKVGNSREMTAEEMEKFDAEYQTLLGGYKR